MVTVMKLIANYYNTDDEDASLHMIFCALLTETNSFTTQCVIANLYRLLVIEKWEPARTYLFMLTGTRVDKNNENTVFFIDPIDGHVTEYNSKSILQICYEIGGPLSQLEYNDSHSDDDESTEYDDASINDSFPSTHSEHSDFAPDSYSPPVIPIEVSDKTFISEN